MRLPRPDLSPAYQRINARLQSSRRPLKPLRPTKWEQALIAWAGPMNTTRLIRQSVRTP